MFKVIVSGLVLLLAHVLYQTRVQLEYSVAPHTLPNLFERASQPGNVIESCDDVPFQFVKEVFNVHDFEEAVKILKSDTVPVVFRGYLQDPAGTWDSIYETEKKTHLNFTNVDVRAFGNAMLRGIDLKGTVSMSLEDAFARTKEKSSSLFASFIPFITDDSIDYLVPGKKKSDFLLDSNFISNFVQDTVSTSFHNAMAVNSYVFQVVGTKGWVFHEPLDYERVMDPIAIPASVPRDKTEKDMVEDGKPILYTSTRPGDLMIFPAHWAHAVISKAGPNVMINLREMVKREAFMYHPIGFIKAVMGGVSGYAHGLKKSVSKRGFTYTEANVMESKWREDANKSPKGPWMDSGCKDFFIEDMYKEPK